MDVSTLNRAFAIAADAHYNQVDKAGEPYISHVARVAAKVNFWPRAEVVAWLHDVVEDHPSYEDEVTQFPADIARAVDILNRNKSKDDEAYYTAIARNPLALIVKMADIHDNADKKRLEKLDSKTAARLTRKYTKAMGWLETSCALQQESDK